jgi:hypothetical protein
LLRRRSPKGGQRSLRAIAAELAKLGYQNQRGAVFSPSAIKSMLAEWVLAGGSQYPRSEPERFVNVIYPNFLD